MNGVGGRTIEEAKNAILQDELIVWHKFREKRGSLHFGRRIEGAIAPVSFFTGKAIGVQAKMEDFMPHEKEPVQNQSDDDMLAMFAAISKVRNDNGKE